MNKISAESAKSKQPHIKFQLKLSMPQVFVAINFVLKGKKKWIWNYLIVSLFDVPQKWLFFFGYYVMQVIFEWKQSFFSQRLRLKLIVCVRIGFWFHTVRG